MSAAGRDTQAGWIVTGATAAGRRRPLFYSGLIGAGMGMLAACADKPPPPPAPMVAALPVTLPPPLPVQHRPIRHPARKPAPPPDTDSQTPEDEAVAMTGPGPELRPPALPFPAQASDLIGLDQPTTARLFGAAAETSEEPPATIWRWRSATCELDLFFYLDLRSGRMRTLHYAFKGEADDAGRQDCLRSLAVARGT